MGEIFLLSSTKSLYLSKERDVAIPDAASQSHSYCQVSVEERDSYTLTCVQHTEASKTPRNILNVLQDLRVSLRCAHVRNCCFCSCRSIASVSRRVINSEYGTPVASHIFGYIEIAVKPGIVLTSFR
jgi:hypothetical protein